MGNVEVLVPIAFFAMIAFITKVVSDNGLRNKLAQRGIVDEKLKYLYLKPSGDFSLNSMKWGMVFIAIGIALFIRNVVPGVSDILMMGWMFFLVGIAFIAYYFIAKNYEKKQVQ